MLRVTFPEGALMSTITNKQIIDRMMANDGWDPQAGPPGPDNPPAIRIVRYVNSAGKLGWGVVFEGDTDPLRYEKPSSYIRSPQVIWIRGEGPQ
jgi:hypothetical protein